MSWILNSTEPQIAEIFSFSESAFHLWESIKKMYGHQNNAARVFQLQKDIAGMSHQGKSFIEHLAKMKSTWNELALYRPHTSNENQTMSVVNGTSAPVSVAFFFLKCY